MVSDDERGGAAVAVVGAEVEVAALETTEDNSIPGISIGDIGDNKIG